ncbi:MAG TPA: NAD(P)/FAD-dependent oxidoreductase [Solirubrobacteraceae bacterium]|nr:NAD(P)/FAD-dependent oxidoreductase [Solirubrobacteraceae bacterium]
MSTREDSTALDDKPSVLIVGAGFGGIAMAIELKRHGFQQVTILERAPDLGGTWYYNGYPGAACDVPSHLYSFSYAQRRDWSRLCSPQAEIHDYLRGVASANGVEREVRFEQSVRSCAWDERAARWLVETESGEHLQADALVLATGQLHQPSTPQIEGIETFAGRSFHSSAWDHEYSLWGRRVAVVGTGASAVQFVPEIAPQAAQLTVFQRTGNWFLPRRNRRYPRLVRAAIEHIPGIQEFRRNFMFQYCEALTASIRHPRTIGRLLALRSVIFMRSQLKDPEVRRKVWPGYTFGCKRVLFSSAFLPALQRENVEVETEPIQRVVPEGIVTADGALHEVDMIVWGTGFKTTDFMFPMEVRGVGGTPLSEAWAGGARAHLGITVPGYPNMFVMYGPNTNTSGGSIIYYLEAQAGYIRQALGQMHARGAGAIELKREVHDAADRALQARFAGTAWTMCDSWYRDERGRIVANWPGYMREYFEATETLDPSEYAFTTAVPAERVAA